MLMTFLILTDNTVECQNLCRRWARKLLKKNRNQPRGEVLGRDRAGESGLKIDMFI